MSMTGRLGLDGLLGPSNSNLSMISCQLRCFRLRSGFGDICFPREAEQRVLNVLFSATSPGNWLEVNEKPGGGVGGCQPADSSSWHILPSRVQVGLMKAEDGVFFQRQG